MQSIIPSLIPSCTFIRHRPGTLTPTLSPPARGPSAERRARPRDSEAQPLRHNLPFVAHKRLTAPQAPPPRSKVRNAVLMAEIDRINHRVRPHPAYVPTEDWLNSACSVVHPYPQFSTAKLMRFAVLPLSYKMRNLESSVPERFGYDYLDSYQPVPLERFRYEYADNFDDETRSIRAQTAALLKRVHSPIPRSRGPLHAVLPTPSSLMETAVPHRHTSDYYIEGLLAPINKVQRDVASRSFYVEHPRPYIGKGNLACMSFAGGKSYAKRRGHYDVPEDHHNVQDDIATLSYYNRARAVANGQEPGPEPAAASSRKSRPYRSTTDSAPAPKADAAPAAVPAPRPAAEPIRTASVKEEPAAEAAAEAELAAETQVAPVSNGVSAEEDEAAKLAAEEAELERQLEAELRAEMEAKEAKKAKKAAAKKAKDDEEAKKAAEEAEAKKQAEEAAAKKAEEEAAAAAAAAAAAEAAAAAAAEAEAAAAAEAARKAAEEEAEIERQVAAELEAEAKKAAEEVLAAAAAEPAEEVSNEERIEAGAEVAPETEAEADAEPEVAAAEEAEPEPEPEPTPEPADEPEPEPEPKVVEAEAEPETAASPEPEAIAEDDPVVEEPESEAVRDEAEEAKSDEDAGWPLDEE